MHNVFMWKWNRLRGLGKLRYLYLSEAGTAAVKILHGTLVLVVSYTFIPAFAISSFRHFEELKSDEDNYRLRVTRYGERRGLSGSFQALSVTLETLCQYGACVVAVILGSPMPPARWREDSASEARATRPR
jgi:hypothetical protein